jgi:hypothetical protein
MLQPLLRGLSLCCCERYHRLPAPQQQSAKVAPVMQSTAAIRATGRAHQQGVRQPAAATLTVPRGHLIITQLLFYLLFSDYVYLPFSDYLLFNDFH